jgi:DNA-binding NtrC family response regulator
MIKVLVVDDEEPFRRLLKKELSRKGYDVEVAQDGKTALDILREKAFDVILLDLVMPGVDGLSLMTKLKGDPASPAIIVLTGKATVETAVEAMKNGAFDYLTKPYKLEELVVVVDRAYEYARMSVKTSLLQQELVRQEAAPAEFICKSRQLQEILAVIKKIAPTDSPVLIEGESGTGKELIANTIWRYSRRQAMPFIALNCSAISETLIESEIFGHEKGAFTNAYQTKHGIVEVADKGTLFLDEIGEMPAALQPKLLRFLDSGEFRRVGGTRAMGVDVRVVAATNRDLTGLIREGKFREDLFYRLNVISIKIPPLRERRDDIPELSQYFLAKYNRKLMKAVAGFAPEVMETLIRYPWPGNARELENVIERAVILCDSDRLGMKDIAIAAPAASPEAFTALSLEDMEREYIIRVLKESGYNQSKASQVLGIDRKTLYLKLKRYGLSELALKE